MLVVVAGLFTVSSAQLAEATTHPTYPLGHAKACKTHYVKTTERHKVKGKTVRLVECVYRAPARTVVTTTTTTVPLRVSTTTTSSTIPIQSVTLTPSFSTNSDHYGQSGSTTIEIGITLQNASAPFPENGCQMGTVTLGYGNTNVSGGSYTLTYDCALGSGPMLVYVPSIPSSGTTIYLSYSGTTYTAAGGTEVVTLRPATFSVYVS